jgi:hypothetical protein
MLTTPVALLISNRLINPLACALLALGLKKCLKKAERLPI